MGKELEEKVADIEKLETIVEQLKAKLEAKHDKVVQVLEEKTAVEQSLERAVKYIQKLKDQIKKIQSIAERRGHGTIVQSIMEESGALESTVGKEFSIFDRLYEDAMRRQFKSKRIRDKLLHSDEISAEPHVQQPQAAIALPAAQGQTEYPQTRYGQAAMAPPAAQGQMEYPQTRYGLGVAMRRAETQQLPALGSSQSSPQLLRGASGMPKLWASESSGRGRGFERAYTTWDDVSTSGGASNRSNSSSRSGNSPQRLFFGGDPRGGAPLHSSLGSAALHSSSAGLMVKSDWAHTNIKHAALTHSGGGRMSFNNSDWLSQQRPLSVMHGSVIHGKGASRALGLKEAIGLSPLRHPGRDPSLSPGRGDAKPVSRFLLPSVTGTALAGQTT
jgi:hypothetical protein